MRAFSGARRRLCRACSAPLERLVLDLGATPLANSYLSEADLDAMEPTYPLRLRICESCLLLQLDDYEAPEAIFSDYAYFSSYSDSWLDHSRRYADMAVERFSLGPDSRVVEVASNDGYLLQYFAGRGIPVLGVDPARNVAAVAEERGTPTLVAFFGRAVARELAATARADLLVANNVLAHVPDLDDFIGGLALLLAPGGTLTIEFPHVERLVTDLQFDTIYHEHFSYFTLLSAADALGGHGLTIIDVDDLPTHGGSLRLDVRHAQESVRPSAAVGALLGRERRAGLHDPATYVSFGSRVPGLRRRIVTFFAERRDAGERIVAYGAAAKGNTLLNYCGLGPEDVELCADRNPHKQGSWLPGSRIPVCAPEAIERARPDVVFILPWNLRDEVMAQLGVVRDWGGRFAWRSADGVVIA